MRSVDGGRLVLDARELAAMLGVSPQLVREMVRRGEVPGLIRAGRLLRFSRAAIERWMHEGGAR